MTPIAPALLADAFVELADALARDVHVSDVLRRVTGHVAGLSGTAAVGLLLADHDGNLQFMAASTEQARLLELFTVHNDEGPCRECFATGAPVIVADLSHASRRWPSFTPRAMVAGFTSVCALPLRHDGTVIGTLNLFGTAAEDLSAGDLRVIESLAHVLTIGILQQQAVRGGELLTEQLRGALNNRIVIEQATGALAQLRGTDVDTAYSAMQAYGGKEGLPTGSVALDLISDPHSHPELRTRPDPRDARAPAPPRWRSHRGVEAPVIPGQRPHPGLALSPDGPDPVARPVAGAADVKGAVVFAAREFARVWHRLVFDENMPEAWRLMDEDFRRVVAQTVLGPTSEPGGADPLVEEFSFAAPQHADLGSFFEAACAALQVACVAPPGVVGPGRTVRFGTPEYDVTRLYLLSDLDVDPDGIPFLADGQSARALTLIATVHRSGTWRMAGVGRVMAPGWPPSVSWEPPAQV